MIKYQVVLSAEDGEYIQDEFTSIIAANSYIVANQWHYGEGQELFIRKVDNYYY
jgi:hypothetical protein